MFINSPLFCTITADCFIRFLLLMTLIHFFFVSGKLDTIKLDLFRIANNEGKCVMGNGRVLPAQTYWRGCELDYVRVLVKLFGWRTSAK